MRSIRCKNQEGLEITFADSVNPFLLEHCEGIYEVKNDIHTSKNTMIDGETYIGSTMGKRNIILTLRDKETADHEANRKLLYNLFRAKSPGTFIYSENGEEKEITYYPESIHEDGELRSRISTVSLICPDPYFYDRDEKTVMLATYIPAFTFRHNFTELKEEFGYRLANKIANIKNNYGTDRIGITIEITAAGEVTNPKITRVEDGKSIQVGTDAKPFEMIAGDKVIITTGNNNKHIYREREGIREKISQYMSNDSAFIQLLRGDNSIAYSASSGSDSMQVVIRYRLRYEAA